MLVTPKMGVSSIESNHGFLMYTLMFSYLMYIMVMYQRKPIFILICKLLKLERHRCTYQMNVDLKISLELLVHEA